MIFKKEKKKKDVNYQRLIVKITLGIIHRRGIQSSSSGWHIRRRLGIVHVPVARVRCSTGLRAADGDAGADLSGA